MTKAVQKKQITNEKPKIEKDPDYILRMSNAPEKGTPSSVYQMIPLILFAAVTIMIVRLHVYTMPLSQFYWTAATDSTQIYDFFSYNKMVFIVTISIIAVLLMVVSLITKTLAIKRTSVYIPMAIYALFVFISYLGSKYKTFALWGANERFEGTIPLLCYMAMLFIAINTINSENNLKQLFWGIAIMAVLLSILGISQAIDKDFFKTVLGQKLISPNYKLIGGKTLWQEIDEAFAKGNQYFNFRFQNKEVYQTVYNSNYVSFYLTILIPVFGMLFIRSLSSKSDEPIWKRIALGILCTLLIFNLIYSKSSGGYMGLGIAFILVLLVLNSQLKQFIKPLLVLIIVTGIIAGATVDRWKPELANAFQSLQRPNISIETAERGTVQPASLRPWLDYMKTEDYLEFSLNGEPLIIDFNSLDEGMSIDIKDRDRTSLKLINTDNGYFLIDDDRFYNYAKIAFGLTADSDPYVLVNTIGIDWPFTKNSGTVYYINSYGYRLILSDVEHAVFNDHLLFGSGRGFIWADSIPMFKHTIIKGYGADTFCIYFPNNDYAWKFNASMGPDAVIDKPHNMYIQTGINTGIVSLVSLVTIYGLYIVQSIKLFWKREMGDNYLTYVGLGLFGGLTAFIITGLVDDSSVSVMPLFYSMLGAGFATNMMIKITDATTV